LIFLAGKEDDRRPDEEERPANTAHRHYCYSKFSFLKSWAEPRPRPIYFADGGLQGLGVVVFFSSVLVVVPSSDWVTVFSLDLTVPSLAVLLVSVLETVRSQPLVRNDNATIAVTAHAAMFVFFIFGSILVCLHLFETNQFMRRVESLIWGVTLVRRISPAGRRQMPFTDGNSNLVPGRVDGLISGSS
jgi:hypothetical protein